MSALRFLDDEAIEALTLGDSVVPELAPLAVFADRVRVIGDEPAPRPSLELQSLFASQAATKANRSVRATRPAGWGPVVRPRRAHERLAGVAGKVAGLGIAAKLALGVSVATAGVAGAGVAGALPDGASQAVQHAIEAVTPFDLGDPDDADRTNRGGGTSTTSGSDGEGGPQGSGTTRSTGTPSVGTGADGGTAGEQAPDTAPGSGLVPGESGAENSETEEEPNGEGRYRGERWDGDGVLTPEGQGPTTTVTTETTPASAPGQDPDAAGDEGTEPRQAWDADAAGSTG